VLMIALVSYPILIRCGEDHAEGLLHLHSLTPRERRIRAAKIWGWMWLCALISAPVCGLHIVLVPTFILAGPVMAFLRYRIIQVPDHVSGKCPSCKENFTLALKPTDRLPKRVYCPSCDATLYLLEKTDSTVSQEN